MEEKEKEMVETDLKNLKKNDNLKYTYENNIKYQKYMEEIENKLLIEREKRENERGEKSGLFTLYKNRHPQYEKK